MKMKPVEYIIAGMDHLHHDIQPENCIILYGDDTMYNFLEELAKILSDLAPNRLYVVGHFYTYEEEPFIITGFLNGKELFIADNGAYYIIVGQSKYKLVDTADGLAWSYDSDNIYESSPY